MDFFQIVEARHSVRSYAATPIEDEKLQHILEAANRAPSAGNLQGYEIYLVRKLELRQRLVKAAGDQEFLAEAPLVLVFCAHPARSAERYNKRGIELYSLQDATIACTFAMLAATGLGLGTVWVGAFDEDAVRQVVGIPEELRPVAMLPVGYAGNPPRLTSRRGLKDIVHKV
jgi:nitroreductase